MNARKIAIAGFLSEFLRRHETMPDRPFCWVLGSGASVQSGIPTGHAMAYQWLAELHELEDLESIPIEQWATAKNLGIDGFDYAKAANSYPYIYQRRFRDYREQGYAFLENAMARVEPSYGYSVLAQIMSTTGHKVAITTNFDNLVADALAIYTRVSPLVCGHESLTGYIRPTLRRPLVAKIHRDLLLNPLNDPAEIEKLPTEWEVALKMIFENFAPIVLGYGGNDGSLMSFLQKLEPIKGGTFWCYRGEEGPDEKICAVVERHRGHTVPIAGFDEVMLQLWAKLRLPDPRPVLQKTHEDRVVAYQNQFEKLNAALRKTAPTPLAEAARQPARAAAAAAVERLTKEKDWWGWQLKAEAEPNTAKRAAIYREGLTEFPQSAELITHFAIFLSDTLKDYKEAERLFRKAVELAPNNPEYIGNLALFMENARKNYDEAERLYSKALEIDSKHAGNTGYFAEFKETKRKDYNEAERLYRKALELDPKNANNTGYFAGFMEKRKHYNEAERLYKKALELDPNSEWVKERYAKFRKEHRS